MSSSENTQREGSSYVSVEKKKFNQDYKPRCETLTDHLYKNLNEEDRCGEAEGR